MTMACQPLDWQTNVLHCLRTAPVQSHSVPTMCAHPCAVTTLSHSHHPHQSRTQHWNQRVLGDGAAVPSPALSPLPPWIPMCVGSVQGPRAKHGHCLPVEEQTEVSAAPSTPQSWARVVWSCNPQPNSACIPSSPWPKPPPAYPEGLSPQISQDKYL